MNRLRLTLAPALAVLLVGCVSVAPVQPFVSTGDSVRDGIALGRRAPVQDRVMWQYRTAALALRQARFTEAKRLLDDAIAIIEGIYGKDMRAKSARTYFGREANKTFIGEPYERVMAYFYRGVLYWMDGEPDNARACFRSAQVHDADAENRTYSSDYVLLDYLDGLASVKLSGDGSDAFKRAQGRTAQTRLPAYDPSANVLVFVEYGNGPVKQAAGAHRELLRFREGNPGNQGATLVVGGRRVELPPLDDLHYQATTRGSRAIDGILAGQAKFRETTDSIGDAAITTGAILAQQQGQKSSADEIGAGLIVFGIASKLLSSATNPTADTRAWDNLPRYLAFTALRLPPGEHTLTAEFKGPAGAVSKKKSVSINLPTASKDVVVFLSDKTN